MGRILLLVFLALFLILASLRQWKLFFGLTAAALAAALGLLFTTVRQPESGPGDELERLRLGYSPDKRPLVTATVFGEALKSVHGLIVSDVRLPAHPAAAEVPEVDALWMDGHRPLERLEAAGRTPRKTAAAFGAHLVAVAWPGVADALARNGLARLDDENGGVLTDPAGLLDRMLADESWASLGLRDQPGPARLLAPAPRATGAGRTAALFLAEALAGESPLSPDAVETVRPRLMDLYRRMGDPAPSAMALFSQFVKQGAWAYPLVLVDAHVLTAFDQAFPAYRETLRNGIRVLRLPDPWMVAHPAASFSAAGDRFLAALAHPDTAALIWERHGLRPLTISVPAPEAATRFALDELPAAAPPRIDPALLDRLTAAPAGT
jgi:hypothetical protein